MKLQTDIHLHITLRNIKTLEWHSQRFIYFLYCNLTCLAVAYMTGMACAMGASLAGCAKSAWEKLIFVTYRFFSLYFAPHTTINYKVASIQPHI